MKILHIADLHYTASKFTDIHTAHTASVRIAKDENVDLIIIAGDTWDGVTQNTEAARFNPFIAMINEYANIAPVAVIYGTPTHDIKGSLETFESQLNNFGITILRPGQPYFLHKVGPTVEKDDRVAGIEASLLLFGVPEPSKEYITANLKAKGKTATDAAVRQEMSNHFLGLAAVRRRYKHLPCILLYHGMVSGSKMQNNQKVDRGSGISITYDDLAVVDADYYALGHIHEPQQIGNLPAYYVGSFYNTSFGETHIPGCNIVEIVNIEKDLFSTGGRSVNVTRRTFGLPEQIKVKVDYKDIENFNYTEYSGKRVWIEIKCTKEQALNINTKELKNTLLNYGADRDSRVTLDIIAVETVRAAEITNKKSLREKVLVWAEASEKEVPETVLKKADELEKSETSRGNTTEEASIQIDKLILRGAIGIWKGLGVDEITVDFNNIAPGIVALIGGNGQGKTTLIENMHPWPQLLTRSKSLKHYFRLKDSFRDLYFTDIKTGIKYRALLEIDGKNKSGSVDYHFYRNLGRGYEPIEIIDGRKDSYVKAIEDIFGSLTLYRRTAFITQKNTKTNPDISDATKGEKKKIFRELAGLYYLEEYSLIAKEKAGFLEAEVLRESGKVEAFSGINDEIDSKRERKATILAQIDEISSKKQDFENKKNQLDETVTSLTSEVEKNNRIKVQIDTLEKSKGEYEQVISENKGIINTANIALKYREEAVSLKEKVENFRARKQEILSAKNEHEANNNARKEKWLEECRGVDDKRLGLKNELDRLTDQKRDIEKRIDRAELEISGLEKETAEKPDTKCPTCRQELPEATRQEILQKWERKVGELSVLKDVRKNITAEELASVNEEIERVQKNISSLVYPPEPKLPPFDDSELKSIESSLSFIETRYDDACSTIKKADEAKSQIEIASSRLKDAEENLNKTILEIDRLKGLYDDQVLNTLQDQKSELEAVIDTLSKISGEKIALETTLREIEEQMEALELKVTEITKLKKEIEHKKTESAEWRMLQDICGVNGIQALELDALSPNIAAIANHILKSAYGSKFQIEFRTVKESGSGSRTEQKEDFSIWIIDIENGTEQELEDLSGGEAVWIRKAIYDAFSIIRANNTGKSFLTAFQDEADGALDPEMKEKYFRMLEAAHNESHRRHTIIITHSREIQEMAQQKIVMSGLKEKAVKAA